MPENSTPKPGAPRADPRSPLVFDVRELGRRAGSMRAYRRSVPAPAGLGLDIIAVPEGAPLAIDVRLESVTEGVLVTGSVSGPVRGECGRCLGPVHDELDVELCELFAYPDSTTDATSEQDEVHLVLHGRLVQRKPLAVPLAHGHGRIAATVEVAELEHDQLPCSPVFVPSGRNFVSGFTPLRRRPALMRPFSR